MPCIIKISGILHLLCCLLLHASYTIHPQPVAADGFPSPCLVLPVKRGFPSHCLQIVRKRLCDCWRFFPPNNFSYLILRWQKASKETATSIICSFNCKCTLLYEARITQSKKFKFLQQCVDLHFAETIKQNQICLCCTVSCIHAVQHLLPFAITLFIWTVMLPLLLLPPHGRCAMMHMSHFHSSINLLDQGPQGIR